MRYLIDKILTFICFFIPIYLICHFFSQSVAIKITLAVLVSVLGIVCISFAQKKRKSKINYKHFEMYVSVHGADYLYGKLKTVFEQMQFEQKNGYLISPQKVMIICSVKFGSVSPDEVLKHSKTAKAEGVEKCYLIAKELPKNAAITLFNFADNLKFIPLKIVFKLLKSHKMLPDKLNVKVGKLNYSSNIFDVIFDKSNIKKFLFVATILFAFSFIIPYKTYYIVLGSINITLAIISVIRGKSQRFAGKYEIFEPKQKENHLPVVDDK